MKREHIESIFNALGDMVATMWEAYEEPVIKPMCELDEARLNFPVGSNVVLLDGQNICIYKVLYSPSLDDLAGVQIATSGGIFKPSEILPLETYSYKIARPNHGI